MLSRNKFLLWFSLSAVSLAAASTRTSLADGDQAEVAAAARQVLSHRCFACHGANGSAQRNIFVLDRERLVQSRAVVPGDTNSLLLRVVDSDAMPFGGPPLQPDEKAALRRWVLAGAPQWPDRVDQPARSFVSETRVRSLIAQDLVAQPARARSFLRYFSLVHLYNAGSSDAELETYRIGLSKLINSLSWRKEIALPAAIDAARTLLRIDLRDYGWTAATWDRLLASYPYALGSAADQQITQLSGAAAPYIRADWFAARASAPPLYHEILELPKTVEELERVLGIDAARDFAEEKNVARAGLRASGVSRNNRVLERHPSAYGSYWKSFDFRSSADQQDIFQNPLAFNAAGSEIIFNLPNGLQGYFVADAAGRRINEAPVAIVSDRTNPDDPVIRNGVSCMSCHYDGIRQFTDEVRAVVRANSGVTFDRGKALAIYASQESFDAWIAGDRSRFETAARAMRASATSANREPVNALARRFSADLTLSNAAAEAGLGPADFREIIRNNPRLEQLGYAQLIVAGGAIKRDAWERTFEDLASELARGQVRPSASLREVTARHANGAVSALRRLPSTEITPASILKASKTLSIQSMTIFLKPDQLEHELRKRSEFEALGLSTTKNFPRADLIVVLDRPVFTYTFTYSVSSAETGMVVMTGKVIAFDGSLAAPKIAKEIVGKLQAVKAN